MTRLFITTAAAVIAFAAPAVSQTAAETAVKIFNQSTSGNDNIELDPGTGITAEAAEIHAQNAEESNMDNPTSDPSASELLDGNSVANGEAVIILQNIEDEDGAGSVN